ncbi:MAG: diguanylate cyclase [Spirochaetes bacterium]|nr:diguanylate cyclase [Spirochaetota bacterium]
MEPQQFRHAASNPAALFMRYARTTLIFLAVVSLVGLLLFQGALSLGRNDSYLINKAGRQRMLSQQLVKDALLLTQQERPADYQRVHQRLTENHEEWIQSQEILQHPESALQLAGRNPLAIATAFTRLDPYFVTLADTLQQVLDLCAQSLPEQSRPIDSEQAKILRQSILQNEAPYLSGMNHITYLYEQESSKRLSLFSFLQFMIFALSGGSLLIVYRTLFRPFARQLSDYYHQTERTMQILADEAATDPLTGLYNKRSGMLLLNSMYEQAKRGSNDFSLIFMDLDGLKVVNDSRGHEAGDNMIRQFATALKAAIRAQDAALRFGGDEFVILLPSGRKAADIVLKRLGKLLDCTKHNCEDEESTIVFSYGLAILSENRGHTALKLLKTADQLMYKQKNSKKAARQGTDR